MPTAAELRAELRERGLDTSGIKSVLQERLLRAVVIGHNRDGSAVATATAGGPSNGTKRPRENDGAVDSGALENGLVQQLECPVCMETIFPPIHQCTAGHLLCSSCRESLATPKKCPECRVRLSGSRNLALERLAEGVRFSCRHDGCDRQTLYPQLAEHIASCDFRPASCPIIGCGFCGSYVKLASHLADESLRLEGQCHEGQSFKTVKTCESGQETEFTNERFSQMWNGGVFDDNRAWSRVYTVQDDDEVAFVQEVVTGSTGGAHVSFGAFFIGPESKRQDYLWTVKLTTRGGRARAEYTTTPLSMHCERYPSLDLLEAFDRGCLSLSALDLEDCR